MKKYISKYSKLPGLLLLLLSIVSGALFLACDDNDSDNGGTPVVNYIRLTNPLKSDSLIAHAFMGNNIAIIGENLQNVTEIWFNDQPAKLNTSFISSTNIIVTIPNKIPDVVTNEIKLVLKNKTEITYPFGVDVPAPLLQGMLCEYVKDGDTAVIQGNFFINDPSVPLQVIFPGNIAGTLISSNINQILVKVPSGAGVGPIQVKSIYGSTRSVFYFRDDRNILLDFDALTAAGGWRSGVLANSAPASLSGNYVRFKGDMTAEPGWNEDAFSFNFWPSSNGRPDAPVYTGNLADAAIKFECNVVEKWQSGALQMIFTPYSTSNTNGYIGDGNVPRGLWMPWKESGSYSTKGWTTVTIPLSEFKYKSDGGVCATALTADMIRGLTFFVWAGGTKGTDCVVHMCIDNIRIVPVK